MPIQSHPLIIPDFKSMLLKKISIVNYRNIEQADLEFSPKLNGFIGNNGMGKTNVLDAIYHLSFCKGALSASDTFNLKHDAEFFMVQGGYTRDDGGEMEVTCSLKKAQRKRMKCDGKDYKRFSEHVGKIPLVLLSPSDSLLVSGGSEERRKFMDSVISQYNAPYLAAAIRYERSLKQRNALLKAEAEPDPVVIGILEDMMSADAEVIFAGRQEFVDEFLPIFRKLYDRLCPDSNEVPDIKYVSHGTRGELKPLLSSWRERERIVGYTLHGTHKDDLELLLNGFPVKREGSQGQTKTFFIAMKLAQYVFLKQRGDRRTPLLLLDDIFDKLDAERVSRIVDYVGGNDFGQIFITDTNREHLDNILSHSTHDYRLFSVEKGNVTPNND